MSGVRFGYRLYTGLDGKLHFDQIVDGRVYPLQPTPADEERELGFYDHELHYLGPEGEEPVD